MVRRFSKRRSKHALNSIHKSCKLQNNLFKCDGLGKCHKNTYSLICQTLFPPPDEHAPYKENFATGQFSPPVAVLFLVLTKGNAAPGHRMPEEILRMHKVVADIAQLGGNVIIIPVS